MVSLPTRFTFSLVASDFLIYFKRNRPQNWISWDIEVVLRPWPQNVWVKPDPGPGSWGHDFFYGKPG